MAASNYGNSAKKNFRENLPYWVKRINYSESLLLFRVKSQQYNKHDNSAFLKVLVNIIIINNLFIIDSKCSIKTNKQQVTKKKDTPMKSAHIAFSEWYSETTQASKE